MANRNNYDSFTFTTILMVVLFVFFAIAMVSSLVSKANCKHPRYVPGMECSGNEFYKECRNTQIYDGCND